LWGTQRADFIHDGKSHPAELSWKSGQSTLWYELKIDGQCILKGTLWPRNFLAFFIPVVLVLALFMLFAHFIR